jgi:hypothetical protein
MLLVAGFTLLVAHRAIGGILERVGHPGATLDDTFIHFQYARAIAEGHPLRYQAGEPISTGATSVLWPLVLAPFHAVGFRDVALLWPAWGLSFAALGLLAWDAAALARPLGGTVAAVTSAGLVLAFGGLVWCAASGMEVVPFAWIVARTTRRASEWAEGERDRRRLFELFACANAAALMRPEGAIFTVAAAVVLVTFGTHLGASERPPSIASRLRGLGALVAPVGAVLVQRALSGSTLTNTAIAKLLVTSPYLHGAALRDAIRGNIGLFFRTILQGDLWSAEFLPPGGAIVAVLGVGAAAALAIRRRLLVRGALVVLLALAMLVPCFYVTFLWNRLRYLWPFATGWLIGLGCLAFVLGELGAKVVRGGRLAGPIVGGILIGLFAAKLPGVFDDVAQSASGVDRQQVAAGRWAKASLPKAARIGINDAGAIAYFSDRRTFDIVGLTTSGEARYWIAGPASRFEHYEKTALDRLPTHFIVYPDWLGCDALLGTVLAEFTVDDATILGGRRKVAAIADWSLLGSGELPEHDPNGAIVDSIDVADLESEADHGYALEGARDGEQIVRVVDRGERTLADGGRTARTIERFSVRLASGRRHHLVARVESAAPTAVRVRLPNVAEAIEPVPATGPGEWSELSIAIPPEASGPRTPVELVFGEPVTVHHYWVVLDR